MKTVLFIDSSGKHYFQRVAGMWQPVAEPTKKDTLWVLLNLPTELLETIDLPRLMGNDRRKFLERRLKALFPESSCRTAHILSRGLFKPGQAVLTGLTDTKGIVSVSGDHVATLAGLWGAGTVLGLMARRFLPPDLLVVLPSAHGLRILVVKSRVPVLNRYAFCDETSYTNEILLTRNYLEDQQIFGGAATPPVLFLGDSPSIEEALVKEGLTLLPAPKEFLPKGKAGWLHPLFNYVVSSPPGQLAPLPLRARYLAQKVRLAAYSTAVASLVGVSLYGQGDWRGLVKLGLREQTLRVETSRAASERERLLAQIKDSGVDPELVRRATEFAAEEITAAPGVETFFSLAAAAIADEPEARVKSLTFHLVPDLASPCQNKNSTQVDSTLPGVGVKGAAAISPRQAEVALSVMLPDNLSPDAKVEAHQRITKALRGVSGCSILLDPTTVARGGILKGGVGVSTDQTDDRWCIGVSWKSPASGDKVGL